MTTTAQKGYDEELLRQAREEASQQISWSDDPEWDEAEKLALACRILAPDGHDTIIPALVLAHTSTPGEFLTMPIGLGLDEATPSRLLVVDKNLDVIRGRGKAPKAVGFLIRMSELRPDIRCALHTHAFFTAALSMLDEPLAVSHMDATMFHNDCAFLREWPGNPVTELEGDIIAGALGSRRAVLLANHGLATVGGSIEEATFMAVCFERAARMQIRARSVGELKPLNAELAQEAHDYLTHPTMMKTQFNRLARQVLRRDPDCLD